MKISLKTGTFVAALCLAAFYVATPYMVTKKLYRGVMTMDANVIERHVDFPSLRESLKEQANAYLAIHMPRGEDGRTGLFGAAGLVMMPKIVEALVDAYVTPTGMRQALERAVVKTSQAEGKEPRPLKREDIDYAFFENPDTFRVEAREMVFILRFKDWRWQLTEARLPPEVFARKKAATTAAPASPADTPAVP
jgi:hypothetical protein